MYKGIWQQNVERKSTRWAPTIVIIRAISYDPYKNGFIHGLNGLIDLLIAVITPLVPTLHSLVSKTNFFER